MKNNRLQIKAEPGKHDATMTRTLNAPRELVFRAYTDPTIIPLWWGPRRLTTTVDRMEVRPGGYWRFVQRDAQGNEYAFHGAFHSIEPTRIVQTFEWEGMPGHVSLDTVMLEEKDGKTLVTSQSVFQSVEDRDGMLQSGMEEGVIDGDERIEELASRKSQVLR